MELVLYSTGCPQCSVLKKKLDAKGFSYRVNENVEAMLALGIDSVPVLSVDGELLGFAAANKWIGEQ